jgi:hypothetical protein
MLIFPEMTSPYIIRHDLSVPGYHSRKSIINIFFRIPIPTLKQLFYFPKNQLINFSFQQKRLDIIRRILCF